MRARTAYREAKGWRPLTPADAPKRRDRDHYRKLQQIARRRDFRVVVAMKPGRWSRVQGSRQDRRDGARRPAVGAEEKRKNRQRMTRESRRRNR